jgi:hypothetical protein
MDVLKPSLPVLITLGSIAVHAEELLSPDGRNIDKGVILQLLQNAELKEWIKEMNKMAMLPVKRITE